MLVLFRFCFKKTQNKSSYTELIEAQDRSIITIHNNHPALLSAVNGGEQLTRGCRMRSLCHLSNIMRQEAEPSETKWQYGRVRRLVQPDMRIFQSLCVDSDSLTSITRLGKYSILHVPWARWYVGLLLQYFQDVGSEARCLCSYLYYFCICRKEFAAGGFDMLFRIFDQTLAAELYKIMGLVVWISRRVPEESRLLVNSDWWMQSLPGTMTLCDISGFLGWFPDRKLVNSSGFLDLTNDAAWLVVVWVRLNGRNEAIRLAPWRNYTGPCYKKPQTSIFRMVIISSAIDMSHSEHKYEFGGP